MKCLALIKTILTRGTLSQLTFCATSPIGYQMHVWKQFIVGFTSATKKPAKQFVFGLLNRFSVDVKDGFNLFEQKLYINVSYINRANNGNSANSDLFMISTAFVQGVWTPPGKAILTEQILQSRSTWAIKWVSTWISRKTLWFCSWNSYTMPGMCRLNEKLFANVKLLKVHALQKIFLCEVVFSQADRGSQHVAKRYQVNGTVF